MKERGHHRLLAGVIAMTLFFIVLFATVYIAVEADHDCSGEDCEICMVIDQCCLILGNRSVGKNPHIASLIVFSSIIIACFCDQSIERFTLVSAKVRLNN